MYLHTLSKEEMEREGGRVGEVNLLEKVLEFSSSQPTSSSSKLISIMKSELDQLQKEEDRDQSIISLYLYDNSTRLSRELISTNPSFPLVSISIIPSHFPSSSSSFHPETSPQYRVHPSSNKTISLLFCRIHWL